MTCGKNILNIVKIAYLFLCIKSQTICLHRFVGLIKNNTVQTYDVKRFAWDGNTTFLLSDKMTIATSIHQTVLPTQ